MKVFPATIVRQIDAYTIKHEPVNSIDLMDRAATVLFERIIQLFPNAGFCVIAGPGNNGGDALFVAQKLLNKGYKVKVWLYYKNSLSSDCDEARKRLLLTHPESISEILNVFREPELSPSDVIVDGLFGSGLTRAMDGFFAQLVEWINSQSNIKLALDTPSGLLGESLSGSIVVKVTKTLSLQFPKLSFFFSENEDFVGDWEVLDIQLHFQAIHDLETSFYFQDLDSMRGILKKRRKFSHKGSYGNVLLIAGKRGMAGASVLAAKAVLKVGAGLVYVAGPSCNRNIVQTSLPESIFVETGEDEIRRLPDLTQYDLVAFGPGVGKSNDTLEVLKEILYLAVTPFVIDADGLNLIAENPQLLDLVPPNSVLSPHPGEFDRLFGASNTSVERLEKLQGVAAEKQLYIILKGAHTAIACPDGSILFNSTGNSGLATAGSGDVLTGMIAGLMVQQYSICDAVRLAVYLHGLSADLALKNQTEETLLASDILYFLPEAFKFLKKL